MRVHLCKLEDLIEQFDTIACIRNIFYNNKVPYEPLSKETMALVMAEYNYLTVSKTGWWVYALDPEETIYILKTTKRVNILAGITHESLHCIFERMNYRHASKRIDSLYGLARLDGYAWPRLYPNNICDWDIVRR